MASSGSKPSEKEWTLWVCDNCGHWHGASYAAFTDEKPPLCKIKGYGRDAKRSCGAVMRRVRVAPVEDLEHWIRRAIHAEEQLENLMEILDDRDDPFALDRMRKRLTDTGPLYDIEFKIGQVLGSSGRPEKGAGAHGDGTSPT